MACGDVLDARRVMEAAGASVAPEIDDGFDVGTAQMGPIWNPGEAVRARMKAGIRNITILYNTFQGIFTKMLFECEVKG